MAASDEELAETLIGVFREVDGLFGAASRGLDLTPQQAQLLCFARHLRPSFGELATLLHCDKTNVTGLVDRLERRGLLTRRPDPQDRRKSRVHLTPAGEDLAGRFQDAVGGALAGPFGSWSGAERDDLVRLLRSAGTTLRG
jgi:DNA-binding MarR family transcriptional regulator